MNSIGIITSKEISKLLEYDRDIVNMLSEKNINAEPIVWDEPCVPWESFDMLLMRTAWGYHLKHDEFGNLLEYFVKIKLNLWNPASVMLENMHKFYLKTLMKAGFNVIPTLFLEPNDLNNIEDIAESTGWERFVLKPAISANAQNTYFLSDINHLRNKNNITNSFMGKQFLLQKYMKEIETEGEWSNIFFSNGYSYSILKVPQKGDYRVQYNYGGKYYHVQPPETVYQTAKKIADYYIDDCLYVRVDGVVSDSKFYVMEVEMIEPDLYMNIFSDAKQPFVDAIVQKLNCNH
ncbi:MAG: hypothetical protein M1419_05070 [Bacteroidetes bacterium]|nr:hypothetical protein [Bacteroidota bacterium]